jgi:MFS transporter, MHS family, proline/betaine transporter
MAAATAGIGLLPGRAAIGVLAPVLLVVFRALQGLSAAALQDWGWRLAFLAAVPLGLVGLYLRLALEDTPKFRTVQRAGAVARQPVADALAGHGGRLLRGLVLMAAASLAFNLFFFYLPSYLAAALGVPLVRTLPAALVGLLLGAAAALAAGRLSDRVGRRPFLLAGTAGLLLVVVPSHLAELFPTPVRSTALAITYGLGTALFGGTAPFLATWLTRKTGNPLAPAAYATLLAAAALVAAVTSRETAFQPLSATDEPLAELARRGP